MSLEYGLYPTEADLSALQEFFPEVNIRKLYEVEKYHQKLAAILDEQFSAERQSVGVEIASLQEQIKALQTQISELGFVGNLSKEFSGQTLRDQRPH
jgi:chromosome segregation ATPase